MKLLLDTADISSIKVLLRYMPIDGITTNPTILAKEGKDVHKSLCEIRELMKGRMIHAQTTGKTSNEMLKQCKALTDFFGGNFYMKIPMTLEGLRAVSLCKEAGLRTTVTTIFTPIQAVLAAKAGADFVAPYVDRLDNITSDGATVVGEITQLLSGYGYSTKVLAASFKNVQQVYNVAAVGAQAVTVSPELCHKLIFHPFTDKSLDDFETDWTNAFGKKNITDFLQEEKE